MGTGRCGTQSLAYILNECRGVIAEHEEFLSSWYNPDPKVLAHQINFLRRTYSDGVIRGSISLNDLPRIDNLVKELDINIVHMWREKEKVTRSFDVGHDYISRILPGNQQIANRNSFVKSKHPLKGSWDIFPHFDADSSLESYEIYYDYYIEEVEKLKRKYSLYDFHIEELNDSFCLHNLYDFLGIPIYNRKYPKNVRLGVVLGQ